MKAPITLHGKALEVIDIGNEELSKFKKLFSIMVFMLDPITMSVLYESDAFEEEFRSFDHRSIPLVMIRRYLALGQEDFKLSLVSEGYRKDYRVTIKKVRLEHQDSLMGIVILETRVSTSATIDERIRELASTFMDVYSSIDFGDEISKTMDLILDEAVKAFEFAHYGSFFTVSGTVFKLISHIGYSDEIADFRLPVEDSFLYRATHGMMDKVTVINDLKTKFDVKPIRIVTGELADLRCSIVAPIFYRESLYGMMSIDSGKDDAFSQDDLVVMTFIRNHIQTIISNQLTFLERSQQALTDPMTGVYNRHFLMEHSLAILERAKRYQERFSVVVFDLDDLKKINDRYGHLIGDQAIRYFARQIQTHSRRSDIVARFGGDEFVAIYLMTDEDELKKKFESFEIHADLRIGNQAIPVDIHFSVGVTSFPQDGDTLNALIDLADSRMYADKQVHKKDMNHVD